MQRISILAWRSHLQENFSNVSRNSEFTHWKPAYTPASCLVLSDNCNCRNGKYTCPKMQSALTSRSILRLASGNLHCSLLLWAKRPNLLSANFTCQFIKSVKSSKFALRPSRLMAFASSAQLPRN